MLTDNAASTQLNQCEKPMVCIVNGKLEPLPRHRSRHDARELKLPLYQPDKPCPTHPDSAFDTANDRCVICTNTTPRAR